MEISKQQERPAAEDESFGGEQLQATMAVSARTSFWSLAQCCRGYLLRLFYCFLKAPVITPQQKDSGVTEEISRGLGYVNNLYRGEGGNGGKKYRWTSAFAGSMEMESSS